MIFCSIVVQQMNGLRRNLSQISILEAGIKKIFNTVCIRLQENYHAIISGGCHGEVTKELCAAFSLSIMFCFKSTEGMEK